MREREPVASLGLETPKLPATKSTVAKGNEFRDLVCRLLVAAGFHAVTSEVRVGSKKVDATADWLYDSMGGLQRFIIEAKDFEGSLPRSECIAFIAEYGSKIENGLADCAWLISRGPVSPDQRALINEHRGLSCFTYAEFQRRLIRVDGYLMDLMEEYERHQIEAYYVRPHTEEGEDLELRISDWMSEANAPPMVIMGSYGRGKSTFAQHLAAVMAREALSDPSKRIPILVQLGNIIDDQAIDGLLSATLASHHRVGNYHFHLFRALNEAGRFLIIFDGLDEMKHGMTIPRFLQNVARLLELDHSQARILILGRDTAFHNEVEFKTVILGRQTTPAGQDIPMPGRRPLRHVSLRDFSSDEAQSFVRRYFPIVAQRFADMRDSGLSVEWKQRRLEELLSSEFDELIVRPVHAKMLCEIASDSETKLEGIDTFDLYDRFIHYLVEREAHRRYRAFNTAIRRRFNGAVAWWLWQRGQASTTTLGDVPIELCQAAVGPIYHDFDNEGLVRELTAGCLVEKGTNAVYFGHRSIQEFLVAEWIFDTDLLVDAHGRYSVLSILPTLTDVVVEFILERLKRSSQRTAIARRWLANCDKWHGTEPVERSALRFLIGVISFAHLPPHELLKSPLYVMLAFYAAGGREDFQASPEALIVARSFLKGGELLLKDKTNMRAAATIIYLWGRILLANKAGEDAIAMLIAACLSLDQLAAAVQFARKMVSDTYYVRHQDHLTFWAFLHAATIRWDHSSGAGHIYLDLKKMLVAVQPFADRSTIQQEIKSSGISSCSVQTIYQTMAVNGANNHQFNTIRSFFEEEGVRSRIRPLGELAPRR